LALFTYDYYYRVEICEQALLARNAQERKHQQQVPPYTDVMIGREMELEEVKTLLSKPPLQIIVVAGPNESGKSQFVSSFLRSKKKNSRQGVIYIQGSQVIDSLSTLTKEIVQAFDLQWLKLRYSLVDVLPFAGSEILVMKERYSDRDLAQALEVVTEALQKNADAKRKRPVIVMDGLGEGSSWFRSPEGRLAIQQVLKWCITITKERKLAHVLLTGNEELVINLTDHNRMTRGHVHVIGLSTLSAEEAGPVVVQEWSDAKPEEIAKLTETFGGFIHDLRAASRQIQHRLTHEQDITTERRAKIIEQVLATRFRLQVERVTAAFAKSRNESGDHYESKNDDDDADNVNEMDPYLDPLKEVYSEARARKNNSESSAGFLFGSEPTASWTQLQLWRTLQRLVGSGDKNGQMMVPFGDLRDDIFDGDITALLELMNEDVLGFEVGDSWDGGSISRPESLSSSREMSWQVKPATPALGRVFQYLVHNSHLTERFHQLECLEERKARLTHIERERRQLFQERKRLDMRKDSLLKTADLGIALAMDKESLSNSLKEVYDTILTQEVSLEKRELELRRQRRELLQSEATGPVSHDIAKDAQIDSAVTSPIMDHASIQRLLKAAIFKTCETEESDRVKLRESFDKQSPPEAAGLVATDIIRLVKEQTGEDIDLETAKSFIRAWDSNRDNYLDYDEFIEMLLADAKMQQKKKTKKNRRTIAQASDAAVN
jgi:ABC-type cobalamin/Fe3+-siderophores transport system ATPase subunit